MAATPPTIGRRIKAALALAGYSIEDLSEEIGQRGLGPRTLRKLQDDSDPREPRAWELRAIADACGVPYAWFTVDDLAGALNGIASADGELRTTVDDLQEMVRRQDARLVVLEAEARQRSDDTARSSGDQSP